MLRCFRLSLEVGVYEYACGFGLKELVSIQICSDSECGHDSARRRVICNRNFYSEHRFHEEKITLTLWKGKFRGMDVF